MCFGNLSNHNVIIVRMLKVSLLKKKGSEDRLTLLKNFYGKFSQLQKWCSIEMKQ